MKSELIVRQYKMNRDTTVTIRSKKDKDADIYTNQITLTHSTKSVEPLKIGTREEIEQAVAEIDMDDDQMALFAGTPPEKSDENIEGLYAEAVAYVKDQNKASTSLLQRRFRVGYGRAARLIEMMETAGVISSAEGSRPRKVLA